MPSIREEELLAVGRETPVNRQGWLEDNINDYSFSSLLGHIDMHLNSAAASSGSSMATGGGGGSEGGSTTGGEEENSPEKRLMGSSLSGMGSITGTSTTTSSLRNDLMSDRCSVISETSVDFVKKFAELAAGMIQEN